MRDRSGHVTTLSTACCALIVMLFLPVALAAQTVEDGSDAVIGSKTMRVALGLVSRASAARLPDCQADQLSLTVDDDGGTFNGMSHAGTLMVLRNIGGTACALGALPSLSFRDTTGRPLDMARRVPPGLHPGPVVRPIALVSGGAAKAALRWVSADVYDGHHCVASATLRVAIGPGTLTRAVRLQACGPPGQPVPFEQAWLTLDRQP